jgi:hypothetical protein
MKHSDNKSFLNTVKYDDNENELERQAEQTVQYDGKIWVVGNKINVRDALTKWQKQIDRSRTE